MTKVALKNRGSCLSFFFKKKEKILGCVKQIIDPQNKTKKKQKKDG